MINDEHRFIYIHPPKTGGTSVEKLFISDADKTDVPHKHKYSDFFNEPRYSDYYFFGTVRNPWDRMVSYYHWRIKKKLPMFGVENFADWLIFITDPHTFRKYNECNWHFTTAIDRQASMLRYVGNIIKFENFQEDFNKVCDDIGIPRMTLPHVNASDRGSYRDYYNDHTKGIVADYYAQDIEDYNYEF